MKETNEVSWSLGPAALKRLQNQLDHQAARLLSERMDALLQKVVEEAATAQKEAQFETNRRQVEASLETMHQARQMLKQFEADYKQAGPAWAAIDEASQKLASLQAEHEQTQTAWQKLRGGAAPLSTPEADENNSTGAESVLHPDALQDLARRLGPESAETLGNLMDTFFAEVLEEATQMEISTRLESEYECVQAAWQTIHRAISALDQLQAHLDKIQPTLEAACQAETFLAQIEADYAQYTAALARMRQIAEEGGAISPATQPPQSEPEAEQPPQSEPEAEQPPQSEPEAEQPQEEAEATPVLDPTALARLKSTLGNDVEHTLPILIDTYLQESEELQAKIQQALAQEQLPELYQLGQLLRSQSHDFGATRLAALCKQMENQAKQERLTTAKKLVPQIEAEYQQVRAALEAVRGDIPAKHEAVPATAETGPPSPSSPPIILNAARFEELQAKLGPQAGLVLPLLIKTFLADAEELQTQIQQAAQAGQAEEVTRLSHTLAQSSEIFGGEALTARCRELASLAQQQNLDETDPLLKQVEAEYHKIQARLEALNSEEPNGDTPPPHVTVPPVEAVLDPTALERLRLTLGQETDAMLPTLIEAFFEDAAQLQANARKALEKGQADELRRAAHTLKSNSANFGGKTLAGLCQTLESQAKNGQLAYAEKLWQQIEIEYKKVRLALEKILEET